MFKVEEQTAGGIIAMIQRDFPLGTYSWGVGVCNACAEHRVEEQGNYTNDFSEGGIAMAMTPQGVMPVSIQPTGWREGAHGHTVEEALAPAGGLAMEKVA